MRAHAEHGKHDLHGRQVGLGTIFAAALYERVLALPAPRFRAAQLPLDRASWGPIADSVAAHHQKQTLRMAAACERLEQGGFARVRDAIAPMLPKAAWIKDVLEQAGAAHRIEHLGIDRERFRWAVLNGAQIRERFTSLDLGWAAGVLPDAADEIIDQYLA
jgi:glycerol dehydrogenase-like iron-containing ADH family enzyme